MASDLDPQPDSEKSYLQRSVEMLTSPGKDIHTSTGVDITQEDIDRAASIGIGLPGGENLNVLDRPITLKKPEPFDPQLMESWTPENQRWLQTLPQETQRATMHGGGHPEAEFGHPMSPEQAALEYHRLNNIQSSRAVRFAHDYEERATSEQFANYERIVNEPYDRDMNPEQFDEWRRGLESHVIDQGLARIHDALMQPEGEQRLIQTFQGDFEQRPFEEDYRQEPGAGPFSPFRESYDPDYYKTKAVGNREITKGDITLTRQGRLPSEDEGLLHHRFAFRDNVTGKGHTVSITEEEGGKNLYVNIIGDLTHQQIAPQDLGFKGTKSLLRALREEFPEAEYISGNRVSGARSKAHATGHVRIKLPKLKEE